MPQILVDTLFVILVGIGRILILKTVSVAWHGETSRGRAFTLAAGLIFGWLTLTSALAASGVLMPSPNHPPPNGAVLAVVLIGVCIAVFGSLGRRIAARVSPPALIAYQVFRVGVELILWALAINDVGPTLLTFEGRNFDIIVGLSAPLVALLVWKRPNKALIIGWNVAGMLILGSVLVHAVLASPGPFQKIFITPDSSIVATWPYVWLPGLLVPLAMAGHLLSIRQALQKAPEPEITAALAS
ncbi:MAG: hypothetical protein R3E76_11265 [Planctomycetota bacterium]